MVRPTAVKKALILLSQTTNDFRLYTILTSLLSPPYHTGIHVPLTQNQINAALWFSAATKFARFLLYYRYISGAYPEGHKPTPHPLSVPYVLEQVRAWAAKGFEGGQEGFKKVKVTKAMLRAFGKNNKVLEVPPLTLEFALAMRSLDETVFAIDGQQNGYERTKWPVTVVLYDVFVRNVSLEKGAEIHEHMMRMVMDWQNAIRGDLLKLGHVSPANCGSATPDGQGCKWNSGGWRLRGLLPHKLFFPTDTYDWPKIKPKAVYSTAALTKIGFTETVGALPVHEYVDFEQVEAGTCPLVQEPSCAICRLEWEPIDTLSKLSCTHIFHSSCLAEWFTSQTTMPDGPGGGMRNPSCPMCRVEQEYTRIFHPDTLPFRDAHRRGRDWPWDDLPRFSPEHFLLHRQPCAGEFRLTHPTLQLWLYVREMYNHGRRLCWAIGKLGWAPRGVAIREYAGIAMYESVSDCDEAMDLVSLPGTEDGFEGELGFLDENRYRYRWEDYGWGGVTKAFLRELGAGEREVRIMVRDFPGLGPYVEPGRRSRRLINARWRGDESEDEEDEWIGLGPDEDEFGDSEGEGEGEGEGDADDEDDGDYEMDDDDDTDSGSNTDTDTDSDISGSVTERDAATDTEMDADSASDSDISDVIHVYDASADRDTPMGDADADAEPETAAAAAATPRARAASARVRPVAVDDMDTDTDMDTPMVGESGSGEGETETETEEESDVEFILDSPRG